MTPRDSVPGNDPDGQGAVLGPRGPLDDDVVRRQRGVLNPEVDDAAGADDVHRPVGRQERLLLDRERHRRQGGERHRQDEQPSDPVTPHQALRFIMPVRLIWWR